MDKLARRLRQDAERIDATVSVELDQRIAASLRGAAVTQEPSPAKISQRPAMFWWASSLTGIAAAAAVIIIVNSQQAEIPEVPAATPSNIVAAVPVIDWKAETAMLTDPLRQELDALQSDIKRAEERVKEDIGL